ncbi:SHOCT domain-containing protein [Denitromonas iodatirespirans]|nr:SHOCT domain-containing protein [Denitromonas iodatirespirans]
MWAYMMEGQGWGHMGAGMIFMAVFWILVIVFVVMLVARLLRPRASNDTAQAPTVQDVLKRRYAAGEIGRDEYEQKMRDIGT